MRTRSITIRLLCFILLCVFAVSLWCYTVNPSGALGHLGPNELQMLMLQSTSLLLMIGAYVMCPNKEKAWRAALITMAFICVSESTLVALLAPVH